MANIIIGGIVFISIAFVLRNMYKSSKNGSSCTGGCAGCSKNCH